ncbi:cell wall-binding repeat-containing protein [Oceanobacillus alkalisoli]|uniref:cell wall-binding repeat-containing protein n=1 Tax=Oceanobacillus alkalisoli TaxID=2925113 RepID=UPI001EF01310|nr:cell wall-binding repeat-containing protein [Oceanobacillus alkalisoli]MCF3942678.1 cell wall-binding repeat-containing protein [Oceanobacillus alkalisoli]MCG5102650.1 cell wall-binding repeat-containing protein [Oceanobacillus alkalisoli]
MKRKFSRITYGFMVLILFLNVFLPSSILAAQAEDVATDQVGEILTFEELEIIEEEDQASAQQTEQDYDVILNSQAWNFAAFDNDVYIGPDAVVIVNGYGFVPGDLYVYGALDARGGLSVGGTLYAKNVSYGTTGGPYYHGSVKLSGPNSVYSVHVGNQPYHVPFVVFTDDLTNESGTVMIEGQTLPFLEVYVQGQEVTLDDKGFFTVTLNNFTSNSVEFELVDIFGGQTYKSVSIADVLPPNNVSDFNVDQYGSDFINVIWEGVNDADLSHYNLYVNDEKIDEVYTGENSYTFTNLEANKDYNLSISAEDNSGNKSEKNTLEIITNAAIPVVNEVTDQDEKVTGTSSSDAVIKVSAAGKELVIGHADSKGAFNLAISKQTAGTELTVVAAGKNGKESEAAKITVSDTTPPTAPEVNEVTDQSTEITGKAEANATVIAKVADEEIGQATASANGNFTIKIAKQAAETEIVVTATDKAGNVSEASKVVVKDVTAPEAPAVNQLIDQSTKITGTAEAASVVVATANDQQIGRVTAESDGTFEMPIKKQAADTKVTVTAKDKAGNESKAATIIVKKQVERISGYMRYDTAVEASKRGWDKAETVIIARGDDFADALAGVPLAHKLDAPILMTPGNKLWDNSLTEIKRLGAKNAIILGGEGAVSKTVANELTKAGLKVERIDGDSRFETAALIAKKIAPNGTKKVVVANGMDFPDALSVASYAAKEGLPILLTLDDRVAKATESAVQSLGVKETLVVGGESVVSKKVAQALPKAERLSGKDRYETNIAIAKHFGVDSKHIYVATGQNYADALTGGVLAAKENSAILLVHHSVPASVTAYMNKQKFQSLSIFGGTGAVDDSIKNELTKRLK